MVQLKMALQLCKQFCTSSCLMTHQPLMVILCHLPEKERKGSEGLEKETKEQNRRGGSGILHPFNIILVISR